MAGLGLERGTFTTPGRQRRDSSDGFCARRSSLRRDGTVRDGKVHIREGDKYRWLWFGYSDDVVERGKVLETNGKDLFRFTFTADCSVTVRVMTDQGETIAELTQENIPTDDASKMNYYVGCMKGWTFYLANLKSILEGGIDLRSKNDKIPKVINA